MRYIVAVLLPIFFSICYAEHVWKELTISGFGEIKIPESMEIQDKYIKGAVDKTSANMGAVILGDRVTIRQLGLNEKHKDALGQFVRFIVITEHGKLGDYLALGEFGAVNDGDLKSYNEEVKNTVTKEYENHKLKIHYWDSASIQKLGRYNAIKFKYERSIMNNEPVSVEKYWIPNKDRIHTIEIQYRTIEESKWTPLLDRIKETIYIIPR